MKILKVNPYYPDYVDQFYLKNPNLKNLSYKEQLDAFDNDEFGWGDFWSYAMNKKGYNMIQVISNAEPLQRAWARENGFDDKSDLDNITVEQVKRFAPEVLWFDDTNTILYEKIRSKVHSIKLTMGACGSFIAETDIWKKLDVIITCAPETVEYFNNNGIRSELLSYAFDSRIFDRIKDNGKLYDVSFMGQIVRGAQFHIMREKMLIELSKKLNLKIFSSSAIYTTYNCIKAELFKPVYYTFKFLKDLGINQSYLEKIPRIGQAAAWKKPPIAPVNLKLKKFLVPPVFGLEMFQAIKDSEICLNIHADSSPKFVSNMRLFEITGIGSCMVVDWKENIKDFFEPDKEVVTYKSLPECVEKVNWLINNKDKMREIALNGQKRTLTEHNFNNRTNDLEKIINKYLN